VYKFIAFFWLWVPGFSSAQSANPLLTPYEIHKTNYTATYEECKNWYHKADSAFETVKVLDYDLTDGGHPLQLAVYAADKDFSAASLHQKNKRIVLIMNAIHPGEPEGVDASMLLLRDMATQKEWIPVLKNVVVLIIPQYNIEGVINRGSFSRANQDGPESYGFRGNGENLDLNRDFIKCDSKNTRAFEKLFTEWKPDVFIDNHTSDGADYQYTLTYITNMPGSLPKELNDFVNKRMIPAIDKRCTSDGFEMIPYVESFKETPDSGITGFAATPRYSMGYAGLYNTIAYTVETHMLKPFDLRLKATYSFMKACINEVYQNDEKISLLRKNAFQASKNATNLTVQSKMDTAKYDLIHFKGYEAGHKTSQVTGMPRLYYDRTKPYDKTIRYYNYFEPVVNIKIPKYYIVPQSCWRAVELLKLNTIEMTRLQNDSTFNLEMYQIAGYDNTPGKTPSNGHYQHHNVQLKTNVQKITFHKGDYFVSTNQDGANYIIQTLEPQGEDSYFSWNLFDGFLQQREYFSDYVFEDIAFNYLQANPDIAAALEKEKKADPIFAADARKQIDWVYRHSRYFEKSYMRYPIGRVMGE